jgi:hypothetical protein
VIDVQFETYLVVALLSEVFMMLFSSLKSNANAVSRVIAYPLARATFYIYYVKRVERSELKASIRVSYVEVRFLKTGLL